MDINRYDKGKIYKLVDLNYSKCYIGSTCKRLSQRIADHRHQYKLHQTGQTNYTSSFCLFDEFGVENCKIELIENYPCGSKDELLKREGHYIEKTDCVNRCVAGRSKAISDKLYRETNRDKLKQYREENKEDRSKYHKQYCQIEYHCEICDIMVRRCNKARHNKTEKHKFNIDIKYQR